MIRGRTILLAVVVYGIYPFLAAAVSVVFGLLFTESPHAGSHRYYDVPVMATFALYQVPFSIGWGLLLLPVVCGRRNQPYDAITTGGWISVLSGLSAATLHRVVDFMGGASPPLDEFLSLFSLAYIGAIYISIYLVFGLSVLVGAAAGFVLHWLNCRYVR